METRKSLKLALALARREYLAAVAEYDLIPDRRETEKETALVWYRVTHSRYLAARSAITRFENAAAAKFAPRA